MKKLSSLMNFGTHNYNYNYLTQLHLFSNLIYYRIQNIKICQSSLLNFEKSSLIFNRFIIIAHSYTTVFLDHIKSKNLNLTVSNKIKFDSLTNQKLIYLLDHKLIL
jgi:hypothetical protein